MARRSSVRRKPLKLGREGFVTTPSKRRTCRTMSWRNCATRARSRSPARGSLRLPQQPREPIVSTTFWRNSISRGCAPFRAPAAEVRKRVPLAAALPMNPSAKDPEGQRAWMPSFVQSGFVQIVPKNSRDAKNRPRAQPRRKPCGKRMSRRVRCPRWPRAHPPAAAFSSPPRGIFTRRPSASAPSTCGALAGAKGKGITICDIEGNWNRSHEDLPSGISLIGGTVINDLGWRNHGTAVLGEMVSVPDQGPARHQPPGASAVVHSAIVNGVFNAAGAIANATSRSRPATSY